MACCEPTVPCLRSGRSRFMSNLDPDARNSAKSREIIDLSQTERSRRLQRLEDFDSISRSILADMKATLQDFQAQHGKALERQEAFVQELLKLGPVRPQDELVAFLPRQKVPEANGKVESAPQGQVILQPAKWIEDPPGGSVKDPGQTKEAVEEQVQLERCSLMPERAQEAMSKPKERQLFDLAGEAANAHDLEEEVYEVERFYKKKGLPQAIARNVWFGHFTLLMIVINALYLGVDAELNNDSLGQVGWYFQVCEHLFCVFFLFEWLMRLLAFADKRDCLRDFWFKFDTVLVVLMVFETWVMLLIVSVLDGVQSFDTGPLRLLRLLRLARMTRLMRALPELMTMVKGMKVASRAVFSSLLMLLIQTYIFAIPLHTFLKTEEAVVEKFGTLLRSMWTLMMDGTFMDSTGDLMWHLLDMNYLHAVIFFMVFVLLSCMTMMNMLIGILCEVVSAVAATEKENAAIKFIKETILVLLKSLDTDGSFTISREELRSVCQDPDALKVLGDLEVDVMYLLDLQAMLYRRPDSTLSVKAIMDLILNLRGDRQATVKDVIDANTFVRFTVVQQIVELQEHIESLFSQLANRNSGL